MASAAAAVFDVVCSISHGGGGGPLSRLPGLRLSSLQTPASCFHFLSLSVRLYVRAPAFGLSFFFFLREEGSLRGQAGVKRGRHSRVAYYVTGSEVDASDPDRLLQPRISCAYVCHTPVFPFSPPGFVNKLREEADL